MRARNPGDYAPSPSAGTGDWRTISRMLPYLWPQDAPALRLRVVIAVLMLVAGKIVTVSVPWFYKQAVDALSVRPEAAAAVAVPFGLLIAYGVARLGQQAFTEFQDLVFSRVVERAVRTLGLKTFRHLHRLSLRFHLDRQTGGLSRVIERGTRGMELLLRLVLFRAGTSALELVFVCSILWSLFDWRFAAVTAGTIGGYALFTMMVTEWRLGFRRVMNQTDAEASTKAIDSLLNYETVKYFGNEGHEARRYDTALQGYEQAALRSKASLVFLNLGQGAIIALGLVIIMALAAVEVRDGAMTVGDFVMVNGYLIQLAAPLGFLGVVYREIKQAVTDMQAMFALLDQAPEVSDRPAAQPLAVSGGSIRFEGVGFFYAPDRPILTDISFEVPAGTRTAIVGASGAGKSTLTRLLFRFYDVTAGQILIDGQDIRDVTQDSLRAAIGVVPQDTVLFNDTIAYNIAYGRPGATRDEVEHAARLAALHAFVTALPQGYDTVVGERGLKLSGGEKQRVAIARTLLKAPPLLILDEATSALDTRTEQGIQGALMQVAQNRTTLVIAHRLSTVVDADSILVLDQGRIAERGRHADLLAAGGLYAAMWQRQHEGSGAPDAEIDGGGEHSSVVRSAVP